MGHPGQLPARTRVDALLRRCTRPSCTCGSTPASRPAVTSSSRTPTMRSHACERTSRCRTSSTSLRGSLHPQRRPSWCRVSTARAWSAARGVQRTATSTGHSRWSRPLARRLTCRSARCSASQDEGVVRLASGGELHADAVVIAAGVDTPTAPARAADSTGGALSLLQRPDPRTAARTAGRVTGTPLCCEAAR